jgi:hypothetical protein
LRNRNIFWILAFSFHFFSKYIFTIYLFPKYLNFKEF